jgi:hypothetical protein
MRKSTKLMVAGLAGTGLLLSACEVPGSGPPLDTPAIVFPNPDGNTPFNGFPAIFKGTNVAEERGDDTSNQGLRGWYDQFVTTIDEPTTLLITCEVFDEGTAVYIDWDASDDFMVCAEDGPVLEVTVDAGDLEIEIGNYSNELGSLHPYVVRAEISNQPT